ncbi:hypothetical protein ACWDZ8_39735, partial [Streptomyces sp. NPDC003233]
EIDMVIDRGAFLAGKYLKVYVEIVAVKQACGARMMGSVTQAVLLHAASPIAVVSPGAPED